MLTALLSGMIEHTERFHVLETREQRGGEWTTWRPAEAGMYRTAYLMAYHGMLSQAIEEAETIRIREYGDMHGVDFRCVTTTRTVTFNAGNAFDDRVAR